MIPPFDVETGALPPGDHQATLERSRSAWDSRLGADAFERPARRGLWAAGIEEIYIDGSFCTEKPDPGDIDGYWVEPDAEVFERIDPSWIDFTPVLAQPVRKWTCRMWADHGVEFFIHPAMQATLDEGFPQFFRHDRDGRARGVIEVIRAEKS